MRYHVTNPKNGSDIKSGKISLKVDETKEYKKSDAEYLMRTFGFLNLRKEEGEYTPPEPKEPIIEEDTPVEEVSVEETSVEGVDVANVVENMETRA